MLTPDLVLLFTSRLDDRRIPYFVTGSVASILYGEPRLTQDVDLVLGLMVRHIPALQSAFPDDQFYIPPREILEVEARRRSRAHFNLIHYESGFRADIYLAGSDVLHRWAMDHRRSVAFGGGTAQVAPPEYVIVRKLEYYREGKSEKHIRDIAGMLAVSGEAIDRDALDRWIAMNRLEDVWVVACAHAEALGFES